MRTLRPSTAVARAKAKAKQISDETRRLNETYEDQSDEEVVTEPETTPPASPVLNSSGFILPRQDTEQADTFVQTSYTIGKRAHALDEGAHKDLAKRIMACTARGNGYAADVMRAQLAEIEERERLVWERRKQEDQRIAGEQITQLLQKRCSVSNLEERKGEAEGEAEGKAGEDSAIAKGQSSSSGATVRRPRKRTRKT